MMRPVLTMCKRKFVQKIFGDAYLGSGGMVVETVVEGKEEKFKKLEEGGGGGEEKELKSLELKRKKRKAKKRMKKLKTEQSIRKKGNRRGKGKGKSTREELGATKITPST